MKPETAKLSTKGQFVIPETFRKWMKLEEGDSLIVEECSGDHLVTGKQVKQILLTKLEGTKK